MVWFDLITGGTNGENEIRVAWQGTSWTCPSSVHRRSVPKLSASPDQKEYLIVFAARDANGGWWKIMTANKHEPSSWTLI